MLGKTIKHEFGATLRVFLPVYAVMLLMAVITRVFYAIDFHTDDPQVIVTTIMVMVFTAAWIVTLVIILRRFWTNQLGREGYLTNVLPVKAWQHVFAKVLTSSVWTIGAAIISVLSILIVVMGFSDMKEVITGLCSTGAYLAAEMQAEGLVGSCVTLAVLFVLSALFVLLSSILQCYTAMTIGQLFNRHRLWAAIAAYCVLSIVCSVVLSVLVESVNAEQAFSAISSAREYFDCINRLLGLGLGAEVLKTAVMFAAPSLLLKYRLNLQ